MASPGIRVNLLAAERKKKRRSASFSLPKRGTGGGGSPSVDPWVAGGWGLTLAAVGWAVMLFLGVSGRPDELRVQIESAQQDSARYVSLIAQAADLQARRDTLETRVSVIQGIDGRRYVWPHILDEVARSIPEYTWLTRLVQTEGGDEPSIELSGRAANTFALTRFLSALSVSPFLQDVQLLSTSMVTESGSMGRTVSLQEFTVVARYRIPGPDVVQMEPLLGTPSDPVGEEG